MVVTMGGKDHHIKQQGQPKSPTFAERTCVRRWDMKMKVLKLLYLNLLNPKIEY